MFFAKTPKGGPLQYFLFLHIFTYFFSFFQCFNPKKLNIHIPISNNLPVESEFITRVLGPTLDYNDVIIGNMIIIINKDVYYILITLLLNTARRGNPSLTTRWENRKNDHGQG